MISRVNEQCGFLLFMQAIKTCCIEATTILLFEHGATGQKWIPFLFDIHWPNTIFYSKNGWIAAYSYHTAALPHRLGQKNQYPVGGNPVNMHRLLVKSVLFVQFTIAGLKKTPEISTFYHTKPLNPMEHPIKTRSEHLLRSLRFPPACRASTWPEVAPIKLWKMGILSHEFRDFMGTTVLFQLREW